MISQIIEVRPPTEREFRQFQCLVYEHAGIHLGPAKRALLNGRLARRIREIGLRNFGSYLEFIHASSGAELIELLDRITTNESAFFREPGHFRFLRERVIAPRLRKPFAAQPLRIWSAGCATGEEPYSLAMLFGESLGCDAAVEITATDLSVRALEQARAGVWPIEKAKHIPEELLKKYMLKGIGPNSGTFRARPRLQSMIRFERLNLSDACEYVRLNDAYDVVFCRNVLIYFDANSKKRVIDRIVEVLAPGGYLFIGHAESLTGTTTRLRRVEPTIYQREEKKREEKS